MKTSDEQIVNNIRESFSKIEKSILSLKDCSNKDFKILASCFEKSVKSVEKLVAYAKSVFAIVESPNSEKLLGQIRSICEENELILSQMKSVFLKLTELKSSTAFLQNLFLVYLENSVQDLKTFAFLGKGQFISGDTKHAQVVFEMNTCATSIIGLLRRIHNIQATYRSSFSAILDFLNLNSFQTIGFVDDPYAEAKREFANKQSLVEQNNSVFSQRQSSHSGYYSEIVTNLQYNDIITQKIEHVSEILSDVSVRLKHVVIKERFQDSDLSNVKKAVELQSAQLVQVNVDYQEALKVIFKRLEELSENAGDISLLAHSFCSKLGSDKSYFYDIIQHLKLPEKYFEIITESQQHINDVVEEASELDAELRQCYSEFGIYLEQFAQLELQLNSSVFGNESSFKVVLGKVNENLSFIKDALATFIKLSESLPKKEKAGQNSAAVVSLKSEYSDMMTYLVGLDEKVQSEITGTAWISTDLKNEIDTLLKNVSYYSLFENEVELISFELGCISDELRSTTDEVSVDASFFDSLKQYYTMKSEHDVHDTVLLLDGNGDNDFDDVEFF